MENLPNKVLVKNFFPYLPLSAKLAFRLVSKSWFKIIDDNDESMLTLDLEKVLLKITTLSENTHFENNFNFLNLLTIYTDIVLDCANHIKRLTLIDISYLEKASSTWPNIRQLILRDVHIDKEWKWLRNFNSLEHFEIVAHKECLTKIKPVLLEAVEKWTKLKCFIISMPTCPMNIELLISLLRYLPRSLTHLQLEFKMDKEVHTSDATEEFDNFFSCHENLISFEYCADWQGFDSCCSVSSKLEQFCPNIKFFGYFENNLILEMNISQWSDLKFGNHWDETKAVNVDVLNLSTTTTSLHLHSNSTIAGYLPIISFSNIKELVINVSARQDSIVQPVHKLATELANLQKLSLPLKYFNSELLIHFVEKCKQLVEIICSERVTSPSMLTNISLFLINAINSDRNIAFWPLNVSETEIFKNVKYNQLLIRLNLPWSNELMPSGPVVLLMDALRNEEFWKNITTRFEKIMIWKSMANIYKENFDTQCFESIAHKIGECFENNVHWSHRIDIFQYDLEQFTHYGHPLRSYLWIGSIEDVNNYPLSIFYDIMTMTSNPMAFSPTVYQNFNFDRHFCATFETLHGFPDNLHFVGKYVTSLDSFLRSKLLTIATDVKYGVEWEYLMKRYNSEEFCRFCLQLAIEEKFASCFKNFRGFE